MFDDPTDNQLLDTLVEEIQRRPGPSEYIVKARAAIWQRMQDLRAAAVARPRVEDDRDDESEPSASYQKPLWLVPRREATAHAMVDETMRAACGYTPDVADHAADDLPRCPACLAALTQYMTENF
jgi:hypothetical protein